MVLFSKAKILSNPKQFASQLASPEQDISASKAYDYVLVGGGTAGCVLAARLSEDPDVSVLLLEAGGGYKGNIFSAIPLGWPKLFRTSSDWSYDTTPQSSAGDRPWYWPRGKMLGGSSSTNAGIYHRCSPEDFSEWVKEGATGWSYDEMKKYFAKAAKFIRPARPVADLTTSGPAGVLSVCFPKPAPIMEKIIDACNALGIPKTSDFNTDNGTLGVGFFQATVDENGRRSSSATAYLTDDVLSRPNLTIGVHVMAEKISMEKSESSTTANGVIFSTRRDGPRFGVVAKKEVILTSGTIGSPLVLLHSGIGPQDVLESKKIKPVVDLPLVGRNLLDHVSAGPFIMRSKSQWTWDHLLRPLWTLISVLQWLFFGVSSPFAAIGAQAALFVRSDDNKLPFGASAAPDEDLTSGPNSPDIEVFFAPTIVIENASIPPPAGEYGITAGSVLLKPKSKGTVEPASSNIWDGPLINPNYFSDPHDMRMLIKAIRLCTSLARTEPLASCVLVRNDSTDATSKFWPADANPETLKDEELAKWIIRNGSSAFHPTSTAKMGSSAADSVVNAELKVHGVAKLRVVDASVFPTASSGHMCSIVVALAERAADLIKEDRKAK